MKKKIIAACIAVLIVVFAGAYLIIKYRAEQTARRQVESVAFRIPKVKAVDYESAQIDWPTLKVRIKNISVSLEDPEETIPIDEILVHDFDASHEVPDRLDVEIRGVHLRPNQPRLEKLQPYLAEADYEELSIDLRLVYRYDRDNHMLAIERLEVEAHDAGRVTISALFNGIDLPRLLKNLTDKIYLITTLPAVSVAAAELTYTDDTLARRLLAAWAQKTQQTPGEITESLNAALERQFGHTDRPLAREALAALKSFVTAPGTLRVAAAPPAPVSFLRFLWTRSPSDVVELLHIRVEG